MNRPLRQVVVPFLDQLGQALAATVPGFSDPDVDLFTEDPEGDPSGPRAAQHAGDGIETLRVPVFRSAARRMTMRA